MTLLDPLRVRDGRVQRREAVVPCGAVRPEAIHGLPCRSLVVFVCATVTVLAAPLASWTASTSSVSSPRASFPKRPCRAHPLAGAYSADRLTLLSRCRAIVGTVREPFRNGDGDNSFNLAPDPAYASMLNATNRAEGGLHIEIVPAEVITRINRVPVTTLAEFQRVIDSLKPGDAIVLNLSRYDRTPPGRIVSRIVQFTYQ